MRDSNPHPMSSGLAPRIQPRDIVDEMETSFIDYAMSVIVQRALPDVRDGLKPVHRRILYAMHELGLTPSRPYKKSASVVGEVLGKYHPHGDMAVYDAMVRMAQDFSMAHPLVDGQGNFGSIDGDSAAAYRYTEARLTEIAHAMLSDLDKNTVDFRDNFDGRYREPEVLPSVLPNLLVNGSEGIAVGMATRVPPHNLREIGAAIALLCERPDAEDKEVYRLIRGPDFPTGGFLVHGPGIMQFMHTGRGKMTVRARTHVERGRAGRMALIVTEIPYGCLKSKILTQIADLVRASRSAKDRKHVWADWITDLRDESDREGIRIVIELKRDAEPTRVLEQLYAKTSLQVTYGAQLLALVQGTPRVLSLRQAIDAFIEHRLEVIVRRARHDLDASMRRAHILEGLLIALADIDRVVDIIRKSRERETASAKLQKEYRLTQAQAEAILQLRLAQLTSLEVAAIKKELAEHRNRIRELQALLADPVAQRRLVKEETEAIVELFGRPRRTQIISERKANTIVEEAAEERYRVLVSALGSVRIVHEGERVRSAVSGDVDLWDITVRLQDRIVFFSDDGRAFSLPGEDVARRAGGKIRIDQLVRGWPARGRALWCVSPEQTNADRIHVLFVSASGYVKRTPLFEYATARSGGIVAANLAEDDRLVAVFPATDDQEIFLATRQGKAIRFAVRDVPVQGRVARGVVGIRLKTGDVVVSAGLLGNAVVTCTSHGYAKRIAADEFPLQRRAGRGVAITRVDEKTGMLVCGVPVSESTRVVLVGDSLAHVLQPDTLPRMTRVTLGTLLEMPLPAFPERVFALA